MLAVHGRPIEYQWIRNGTGVMVRSRQTPQPDFLKIRLAEPYFRLISGLAEFLRKLRNSAENTPEHHKFGQQDRQRERERSRLTGAGQSLYARIIYSKPHYNI